MEIRHYFKIHLFWSFKFAIKYYYIVLLLKNHNMIIYEGQIYSLITPYFCHLINGLNEYLVEISLTFNPI